MPGNSRVRLTRCQLRPTAEVQNGPDANGNNHNGPKLKWPTVMSRTARVIFIAKKNYKFVRIRCGGTCNEFYCKIFAESATDKISKNRSQIIKDRKLWNMIDIYSTSCDGLYCADVPLRIKKFSLFRKFLRILKLSVTKSHSVHLIHTMNTRQQETHF